MISDHQWAMPANKDKALMLAQRQIAVFVCDAVNLEGINMTLPEVQTLLDGITVGGHRVSDQQITINQGLAWKTLFRSIKNNSFVLDKPFACHLHSIAAKEEALQWGEFRTGQVMIAGIDYMPPAAEELTALFNQMIEKADQYDDIYVKAIAIFRDMARQQYFDDVNNRIGRLMMNGVH